MDPNVFPTKGNLIRAKNSLALADMGYDLMDRKRNILIREIMNLIGQAHAIQSEIDKTFREAYIALQKQTLKMASAMSAPCRTQSRSKIPSESRRGVSWA